MTLLSGTLLFGFLIQRASALDQNSDGASDVWQARYGIGTAQLAADNDGDGLSNLAESRFGLNPSDARSTIRLGAKSIGVTDLQLSWSSVAGIRYQIQYTALLSSPAWNSVGPV